MLFFKRFKLFSNLKKKSFLKNPHQSRRCGNVCPSPCFSFLRKSWFSERHLSLVASMTQKELTPFPGPDQSKQSQQLPRRSQRLLQELQLMLRNTTIASSNCLDQGWASDISCPNQAEEKNIYSMAGWVVFSLSLCIWGEGTKSVLHCQPSCKHKGSQEDMWKEQT